MRQSCDVVGVVGPFKFSTNRSWLLMHSPVLRAMLINYMKESRTREITLHDLKSTTWKLDLDCMICQEMQLVSDSEGVSHGL